MIGPVQAIAAIVAVLAILFTIPMFPMFSRKRFDPKGKFCYVTGGSAGLGKALAEELARRGAHVVIVARDAKRSAATVEGIKALAGPDQKVFAVSADLKSHEASESALTEAAASFGGQAPDYVFLCAGYAKPRMFLDATAEDLQGNFDGVYWVSAWTAHAASQMMAKQRRTGMLTFVSSFAGYAGFAGYSPYAPGKYALRGLSDCLRNELKIYGIDVRIYMPAGMSSPGYEEENKEKPAITKSIEEDDVVITPEKAASFLIKGIERGHYQITNDFMSEVVRCGSNGPVPANGPLDMFYRLLGLIIYPIFHRVIDGKALKGKKQVYEGLEARGFFN